jgi:GT2 family glycosyltransferase
MKLFLCEKTDLTIIQSWDVSGKELPDAVKELSDVEFTKEPWLLVTRLEGEHLSTMINHAKMEIHTNDIIHFSLASSETVHFNWPASSSYNWQFLPHPARHQSNSWRTSADFFLIKLSVFNDLTWIGNYFSNLDIALSELSFRALRRGALIKKIEGSYSCDQPVVPTQVFDEVLFARIHLGKANFRILVFMKFMNPIRWFALIKSLFKLSTVSSLLKNLHLHIQLRGCMLSHEIIEELKVPRYTAIVPTILRYEYLKKSIDSLLNNQYPPDEIIVVDQTPLKDRNADFYLHYPTHVRVYFLDESGQCTSRNLAIQESKNEWLLLFEDDAEAWPEMIIEHWKKLFITKADASTGVSLAPWKDTTYIPVAKRFAQLADVFATGNCFVKKESINQVGGLHMAFNRGSGADDDLGKRMYLNGSVIIFNPQAIETHHKAPTGGMRVHGAWWRTKTSFNREYPPATHLFAIIKYYPLKNRITLVVINVLKAITLEKGLRKILFVILFPYRLVKSIRMANNLFKTYEKNS